MASYARAFSGICQECEKQFPMADRFCTVVNLDMEGFEKDKFLDGSLNRVCCPFCNTEFTFELPMIVLSGRKKFACLVDPNVDIKGIEAIKNPPYILFGDDFNFRCVRYMEEAREKIRILDSGCDDIVIEYIKLISFNDEDALPFDEVSLVFNSKKDDTYEFLKLDYNCRILDRFLVDYKESDIPDVIKNMKYSLDGRKWHKADRISLKEELICQNIKISL